jgi:hypothetical protein
MDFKLIHTDEDKDLDEPKVSQFFRATCAKDVMDQVDAWKYSQGVLIYANDYLHAELVDEHKVTQVTE